MGSTGGEGITEYVSAGKYIGGKGREMGKEVPRERDLKKI